MNNIDQTGFHESDSVHSDSSAPLTPDPFLYSGTRRPLNGFNPTATPFYPPGFLNDFTNLSITREANNNVSLNSVISHLHSQGHHEAANSIALVGNPVDRIVQSSKQNRPELNVIRKFGSVGTQPGHLNQPHGFCIGVEDNIVIADTDNHRISIFDVNGNFIKCFGVMGQGDGQLFSPRKVAMIPPVMVTESANRNPLYVVCDRGSSRSRMQIFKLDGTFVRKITLEAMDIISGLTTTEDRRIIVVDSVKCMVHVFDEFGNIFLWFPCLNMKEPSDIAMYNSEYYVCDFKGDRIAVYGSDGLFLRTIGTGFTRFPNGIDISDSGDVVVGDSHGNYFHVVLLTRTGELLIDYHCSQMKVSRCCGLLLTETGKVVTVAKSNNHVVIYEAPKIAY